MCLRPFLNWLGIIKEAYCILKNGNQYYDQYMHDLVFVGALAFHKYKYGKCSWVGQSMLRACGQRHRPQCLFDLPAGSAKLCGAGGVRHSIDRAAGVPSLNIRRRRLCRRLHFWTKINKFMRIHSEILAKHCQFGYESAAVTNCRVCTKSKVTFRLRHPQFALRSETVNQTNSRTWLFGFIFFFPHLFILFRSGPVNANSNHRTRRIYDWSVCIYFGY